MSISHDLSPTLALSWVIPFRSLGGATRWLMVVLALILLLGCAGDGDLGPATARDHDAGARHDHGHEGHGHQAHADHSHGHDETLTASGPESAHGGSDGADHELGGNDHDDEHADSVHIGAEVADRAGIRVEAARSARIRREQVVQGLLVPVEGRSARVVARFPGPVRQVRVSVGDRVRAGQVLALVESNISLSSYPVTAPIKGTVLARHASVGDLAGESPLFEIADLSQLWVDLHVFGADGDRLAPGLPVRVERLSDDVHADLVIERVLPGAATASQSTVARAVLDNGDGRWRPGSAVRARVTTSEREVPLSVPLSALQRLEGRDVVFVRDGDEYSARPVQLGERDAARVEVRSGVQAGDQVVVEQSYLIKADLGKAGAAHEH